MIKKIILTAAILFLLVNCASKPIKKEVLAGYRPWGMIGGRIADTYAGVKVMFILPGSPAEKAGLKKGDFVKSIDNRIALKTDPLVLYIRSRLPGTLLNLQILRNLDNKKIGIIIGKFPEDEQLYQMTRAAFKAYDFHRALMLINRFEKSVKKSRRKSAISSLKTRILQTINK